MRPGALRQAQGRLFARPAKRSEAIRHHDSHCPLASGKYLLYGCLQFVRVEAERPWTALISHAAPGINHVEAIRPCGVRTLRRVAKLVEVPQESRIPNLRTQAPATNSSVPPSLRGLAKTTLSLMLLSVCQTSVRCASVM